MRKLLTCCKRLLPALLLTALLSACSDVDKAGINALLDARDAAISERNIGAYSSLLLDDYKDEGQSKVQVVAKMISLFDRFQKIEMQSRDREIRLIDDTHAQCQQSYVLRVQVGKDLRTLVQREALGFTRTPGGWRISSGL